MAATMAFLGDQQMLEARLGELEQIRLIWQGRLTEREALVTEAQRTVAQAEGAIGEIRALLTRYEQPTQQEPEGEGE